MPEQKPDRGGAEEGRRRIDLSGTQVAASALATVVGAVLASELGVYGTILGAAVVSIGATTGGALFQHLFRRTGEQLRGAVDRASGPGQLVNGLRQAPDRTDPADPATPPGSAEWSEPRVVRARRRWGWKTYAAVSALVFTVAMVPILAFELATGRPVSATVQGESGTGTSLGGRVDRKPSGDAPPSGPAAVPSPSAGRDGGGSGRPSPGARPGTEGEGSSSAPSASPSGGPSGGSGATPSGPASGSPSARPSAEPSGSAPPSAPSGGGSASAKPSGGATPRPPDPTTAVVPPPAPDPATAPRAPQPPQAPQPS
ncbi:hypothetical protein ACIQ9P_30285 [Kitasatospora sp. NPDC094019]|uniref:hypothetical protein n=1 Tax=Kitasatospora sp. NPDC094019 TaxID=3364091 RepID=UPI00380785F3